MQPPQSMEERKANVLDSLRMVRGTEKDIWVASASVSGEAYLIPLSFYWDGERLTLLHQRPAERRATFDALVSPAWPCHRPGTW